MYCSRTEQDFGEWRARICGWMGRQLHLQAAEIKILRNGRKLGSRYYANGDGRHQRRFVLSQSSAQGEVLTLPRQSITNRP